MKKVLLSAKNISYLSERDFPSAYIELQSIEQDYDLTDEQVNDHENFIDIVSLLEALDSNSRTIFEFTSNELQQLDYIANAKTGLSSVKARNILCYAYDLCEYEYANPSSSRIAKSKSTPSVKPGVNLSQLYNTVVVSPNPAKDYTQFEWELPYLEGIGILEVFDMNGVLIYNCKIQEQKGNHTWNTSGHKAGVYNYRIISNELVLNSGKIIVN